MTSRSDVSVSQPRVCFVSPYLFPVLQPQAGTAIVGGAEVQQGFIARQLVARGYDVVAVCEDFGQPDGCTADGVRVFKSFRAGDGLRGLRALHPRATGLWRALARADADVYYVRCAAMALGLVAAFCRLHGRKCVFAGASNLDFVPGKELVRAPWDRAIYRWGLRRVDAVVAQNPTQVELCRQHHGIDATLIRSTFVPADHDAGRVPRSDVLWCGVLREAKRVEDFIELARRMPESTFRIVGGADSTTYSRAMAERLRSLAAELPNLHYDGFLPYIEADLRFVGARVFVNTSLHEGFPNTFLQAWSRGVPTLSYVDVGAAHDGVPVGHLGADLDDMERQLRRWLAEPASWRADAARARQYFDSHHSADATMSAYCALFDRLAGHAAGAPMQRPIGEQAR